MGRQCANVRGKGLRLPSYHMLQHPSQMLQPSYTSYFLLCKLMYRCTKISPIDCITQLLTGHLEDRQDVRRRSDAARYVDRLADNEELIPSRLLAMLSQRFKIEQLSDGHTPASKHDLVTRPFFLRWPRLPGAKSVRPLTRQCLNSGKIRYQLTNSDDPQRTPRNSPT